MQLPRLSDHRSAAGPPPAANDNGTDPELHHSMLDPNIHEGEEAMCDDTGQPDAATSSHDTPPDGEGRYVAIYLRHSPPPDAPRHITPAAQTAFLSSHLKEHDLDRA